MQPEIGRPHVKERQVLQPPIDPSKRCGPNSKILHCNREICRDPSILMCPNELRIHGLWLRTSFAQVDPAGVAVPFLSPEDVDSPSLVRGIEQLLLLGVLGADKVQLKIAEPRIGRWSPGGIQSTHSPSSRMRGTPLREYGSSIPLAARSAIISRPTASSEPVIRIDIAVGDHDDGTAGEIKLLDAIDEQQPHGVVGISGDERKEMVADLRHGDRRVVEVLLRRFQCLVDRDSPLLEVLLVDRLNRFGPVVARDRPGGARRSAGRAGRA